MSASEKTIDILFFGDLVGRPGRKAVQWYLSTVTAENKPDVVIANVENASHGFGLTEKNYNELLELGIDVMTSGNHIWDKRDILNYIEHAEQLLRPSNFRGNCLGQGHGVFDCNGVRIGVINLMGQVFMGLYDSPWDGIEDTVTSLLKETPIVFLDFHAEATAEKIAFGRYVSQLGVSAFTGTHTHVQTADNKIVSGHMGYISDTGFCGVYDSVIGMMPEGSIQKLRAPYPARLDVADESLVQVNATRYTICVQTGVCQRVERINLVKNLESDTPAQTPMELVLSH